MPDRSSMFEATVKNLLRMKPKPHDEALAPQDDQSESGDESIMDRKTRSKSDRKSD